MTRRCTGLDMDGDESSPRRMDNALSDFDSQLPNYREIEKSRLNGHC